MSVSIRLRSLTTQLVLVVVFPVVILLALVSYSGVSLHEDAMRTLVSDRDKRAVSAAAEALADRFQSRMLILKSLAERVSDGRTLESLLIAEPQFKQLFDGGLIVANKRGEVIESWQPGVVWADNLRSATSPWVLDHDRQPPLVVLNTGSTNNETLLFGGISLPNLNVPGAVDAITASAASRLVILADDGHVIQDTTGQAVQNTNPETGAVVVHDLAMHTMQSGQSDLVVVSNHVEGLNWTLILQEPWAEVTNPMLKMSLVAPLAAIPALLLAVSVLVYGIYSVVLPLRRLGRSAAQIPWGNYGLILEPVGGVQEIRDLQISLNHMAQRLQEAQNAMQSYIGATLQGQEEERKRLARELHDDMLQSLIALDQKRQMVQRALERDPGKATAHLDGLHLLIDEMITSLRQLLRDMRPSYIEDLGLTPALEMLGSQMGEKFGLNVQFKATGMPRRLPPNHELGLYRIAQEALNNVGHHARASQIEVSLCFDKDIILSIKDDGQGFTVPDRPQSFAQAGHYGLMGMVERTEQMQGQFAIRSHPGKGTTLTVTVPIATAPEKKKSGLTQAAI